MLRVILVIGPQFHLVTWAKGSIGNDIGLGSRDPKSLKIYFKLSGWRRSQLRLDLHTYFLMNTWNQIWYLFSCLCKSEFIDNAIHSYKLLPVKIRSYKERLSKTCTSVDSTRIIQIITTNDAWRGILKNEKQNKDKCHCFFSY